RASGARPDRPHHRHGHVCHRSPAAGGNSRPVPRQWRPGGRRRRAGRDMSAMPGEPYDILVIGGGINGAGIARDAAGRGYSVCLVEAGDFGGGTSSASTKLVHGGLRYLEYFELRLVREALREREVLLAAMPHICWPMRF